MGNRSKCETYLQFPIKAIGFNESPEAIDRDRITQRLHDISDYAIWHLATPNFPDQSERFGFEIDDEIDIEEHLQDAAESLGFVLPEGYDYELCEDNHKSLDRKRGGEMLVRIRSDIYRDMLFGNAFTWRQFAAMCSVNAMLNGHHLPRILRRDQIRSMSLGCKNMNQVREFGLEGELISVDKLRSDLDHLEDRGMFHRCQHGSSHSYFSQSMTEAELIRFVANKKRKATVRKRKTASQKSAEVDQLSRGGGQASETLSAAFRVVS